jgi:hypothetical protein
MAADRIELADLIENLREELYRAKSQGKGKPLRFQIDKVELELQVGVQKAGGVEGGLKFWVLNFGADAKAEKSQTQTMKLALTPYVRDAKPQRLSVSRGGRASK